MSSRKRIIKEKVIILITALACTITALILVVIIGVIAIKALPALNLNYITESESQYSVIGKAIGNAIAGTIILSVSSVIVATPLAIGTAIYLKRYAKENTITHFIRLMIEVLSGTPSIVIGVIGLVLIVVYLKPFTGGQSLISGSIALGILIMPVIERATEEAISSVPRDFEDASYALGATRWGTVSKITLPLAISGILTGIVLGVGRAAEESAVVILTAGYSQFSPSFGLAYNSKLLFNTQISPLDEPIATLPIAIYNAFNNQLYVPAANGFAAALILIIVVLMINIFARLILWRFRINTNPSPDSGTSHGINKFFKKKGPGNSGSTLIPHVGIFNRSKTEPIEKQMAGVFSELRKKPDKSEVQNSIRPYLADPLKETTLSPEHLPAISSPTSTIEILPKEASQISNDTGQSDKLKMSYIADSQKEIPSTLEAAPIAAINTPTIETLPNETSHPSPDQSVKPVMNEDKSPSDILIPPSDKPQLPEVETPYSVFVVDPVKLTEDEVLKEDSGTSQISVQAQPSLHTPSTEPILPSSPIQLTGLANSPALEHADVPIQFEEPVKPTIEIMREPAPSHMVEASADRSSLQLIVKEDKPMIQSNPTEKTTNGPMSKTKDGKPFLDLLHPPSENNAKKAIITSTSKVSQVSDIAMPYTISGDPDVSTAGLLTPGYVELSPSEDTAMSESQTSDEKTPYTIISEHASMAKKSETSLVVQPIPEKINDITHKVKDPVQLKAKSASDFDLSKIFGGFKKNSKGNNGNNGNGVKVETSAQASPTEDEVKSTLQKPAKKNSLLSSLNLSFSKPKEVVELLDFNVGKLSIPTLDGALKETDVTYEIDPPFQYVHVFFDGEEMSYNVLEPKLSDGEKKYLAIIERALEKLISAKIVAIRPEEREDFLRMRFMDIVKMYGFNLSEAHQDRMFYYIRKNYLGLSKIDVIMKDHYIEDVSCNGPNNYLYVYHRVFGSVRTNVSFEELELNKFVMRLAQISGKHISILQPIKDVSMPDGSRANLTMGSEVTKKGATFTIRKFRDKPMSPVELMEYNSIDPLTLAYLWILLDYKKSILVSGGTASGKTTLLNVICSFIRPENKIVSLEDTAELNLVHPNWIQSVTRSGFGAESGSNSVSGVSGVSAKSPGDIGLYDLLVAALRQRPEYIICGEVRGAEAFTMFQAIAVGHACMGTIHAGTMRELLSRIESNPMNVPRTLFSALDAVCFNAMVRHGDRNVRRVMSVVEILELDADGDLVTNPVFRWDAKNDRFLFTGKSHIFEKIETQLGVSEQELVKEMQSRGKFLRNLREHNIRDYAAVVEKIHEYTLNHS